MSALVALDTSVALVALAASEHGVDLATRDARAEPTYEAVGARILVADGRT